MRTHIFVVDLERVVNFTLEYDLRHYLYHYPAGYFKVVSLRLFNVLFNAMTFRSQLLFG